MRFFATGQKNAVFSAVSTIFYYFLSSYPQQVNLWQKTGKLVAKLGQNFYVFWGKNFNF